VPAAADLWLRAEVFAGEQQGRRRFNRSPLRDGPVCDGRPAEGQVDRLPASAFGFDVGHGSHV